MKIGSMLTTLVLFLQQLPQHQEQISSLSLYIQMIVKKKAMIAAKTKATKRIELLLWSSSQKGLS